MEGQIIKGLNDALAYIEKNLPEQMNEKKMARVGKWIIIT